MMLGIFKIVDEDKPLGGGGFGKVYRGENTKTKENVAIKRISVENDTHGMLALREIKHYETLGVHPHIVRMYDYHYQSKAFWIVMELCTHGDLNAYFKKNYPGIDFIVKIIHESISAVSYMHNLDTPIVHRDIKPDNILLTEQNGAIVVRLTDFGISKIADDQGPAMMKSMIGTPPFMAPELFVQATYDERVDIFSLGLVLLAMLNYQKSDRMLMPKTDSGIGTGGSSVAADLVFKYKSGDLKDALMEVSTQDNDKLKVAKNLVNRMTQYKPDDRIPLKEALQILEKSTGKHISLLKLPQTKERSILMSNEITPRKTTTENATHSSTDSGEGHSNSLVFKLLNDALQDRENKRKKDTSVLGTLAEAAAADYKTKGKESLVDKMNELTEHKPDIKDKKDGIKSASRKRYRPLQKGDVVQLNAEAFRLNKKAEACKGIKGYVAEITKEGMIFVKFITGEVFKVSRNLVDEVDHSGHKIEVGDYVLVIDDKEKVKQLQGQKNKGGWIDPMASAIGKPGEVRQVDSTRGVARVEVAGKRWIFHIDAIRLVAKAEELMQSILKKT